MNTHVSPSDFDHINASAIETEQALIGACMMHSASAHHAMGVVEAEHFGEALHQHIWRAVTELVTEGRPANVVTLKVKLGNSEIVKGVDLGTYLARLAADTHCTPAYVIEFARQVREYWALRQVAQRSLEARGYALSPGTSAKDLISDLIQTLDQTRAVIEGRPVQGRMLSDGTDAVIDRMNRGLQGEVLDLYMTTGLQALDHKLGGGFSPGQLILIAGRPGMGKSVCGVSIARQAAMAGHAGGFFSLEMPGEQISARFISDQAYSGPNTLTSNQILMGHLRNDQAERAIEASRAFRDLPLALDDSSSLTVGEIGARARALKSKFGRQGKKLDFIVIDYLKFIRASERYRGQRHYEVGEISAGLKNLAKDLGIAVVLLVQLNREVEKRQDKRPELADLRESGDLEADADVVLLLFREAYYLATDKNADPDRLAEMQFRLEIIVAKQRMGATGSVDLFCHPGASALRDLARY